jgi:excisionase family DNA binding protein
MKPPGGPDPFDDWIGIDEAAAYLAIPVRTLYLHAQQGRLPATKVGRTWRFKRSRLDEHLGHRGKRRAGATLDSSNAWWRNKAAC